MALCEASKFIVYVVMFYLTTYAYICAYVLICISFIACRSVTEVIAHDKELIETLLAVGHYDVLLYLHATAVSCLEYYKSTKGI
jgi:hypothetical protein